MAVTMSPDVPLFMQVFCACLSFITGGAAKSFDPGRPKLRYDTGLPRHFCVGGVSGQFAEGTSTLEHRHVDGLFHFPSGGTMTSRRMLTRDHLHAINACPSPTGFSGHGSIAVTMSPDVPPFMQVFCACLSFITGGAAKSFDPGRPKLRYDTGLPRHFCVGGVSGQFAEGTSTLEHRHVDGLFHFPSGGTMTSRRMLTRDHLHAINACPSPTGFSGHGGIAVTMSPDVPLFMQVFCACLSFITGGAAKSFDPGRPKLRYDTGLPRHFCVGCVSGQFAEGTSTLEHRHVDGLFHFPSGGTMTSRRMLTRDHLHAINACPSPTGFSGHGSIAVTMSPDVPLFMQVGDQKNGFHSNVVGLIVLPCPRVVFDCICECFSIAGLLFGLSGDVEKNPGPITGDLCRELLQNQKEILSKLTAVQEKQDSFETRFLEMQNRLLVIETKVQSLDETRNRLATLEETVADRRLETSSLVKQVDDLDNRSRRNNLIIRGVAEEENEKEETLVKKVKDDIFNATLKVNVNSIDRIHRLGKKLSGRTPPVILRVADYRDKINVLQNCSKLKDTDYSISEDFSKRVQGIRKKLWDSAGDERKAGRKVKLVFDKLRVNNTLYSWNEERE
ncbi:LOW QUALITY PROTEIN: uncharacterized protein LOC125941275 [Dermacentor silvarum]|uniref:LOW QUALITY PROTEIN: uncharacterized protein LOC125941275 n=1 Tax=Dermacentor silvarum TaxID=543639 RepID=UPI002101468E|nr:LOW QUALITY PROTEIN: uncharacterized protein LOC125941275 [Dermacentor silvarum]